MSKENYMEKKQVAFSYLKKEFNCAQSTFLAFSEDVGIGKETAIKIAACFGGGMKCGEVCGAITGILMAIGMKYGNTVENDYQSKQLAYQKGLEFINRFKSENGSILCRDLLGYDTSNPAEMKKVLEQGLHITVCSKLIADAVDIAEEMIWQTSKK